MNYSDIPLIPRNVFFANPDRAAVTISPDGAHLAWLAPLHGVLNVWVAKRNDLATARHLTHDTGRGIRIHLWVYTNSRILYMQDKNGMLSLHIRIPLIKETGVEIVSGTHKRWDTELEKNVRMELNGHENSEELAGAVLIHLESGDVLIFSAQMIHRGSCRIPSILSKTFFVKQLLPSTPL